MSDHLVAEAGMDAKPRFTIHEDGEVSSRHILRDATITFTTADVPGPPYPTQGRVITMDIHTFVHFFRAMRPSNWAISLPGSEYVAAYNIIVAGVGLAGHKLEPGDDLYIARALAHLETIMRQWPDLEALVLEYTYIMLRNKKLTHEQAADAATVLLGSYISRDAWRMRVKKFAKEHDLPQVEQRKRKQHA